MDECYFTVEDAKTVVHYTDPGRRKHALYDACLEIIRQAELIEAKDAEIKDLVRFNEILRDRNKELSIDCRRVADELASLRAGVGHTVQENSEGDCPKCSLNNLPVHETELIRNYICRSCGNMYYQFKPIPQGIAYHIYCPDCGERIYPDSTKPKCLKCNRVYDILGGIHG